MDNKLNNLSLAQIAEALLGGQQTDRLLKLHTPLDEHYGPDTLIPESLEGVESISQFNGQFGDANEAVSGYRFSVIAVSHQSDIPLSPALGQPVLIELLTAQSREDLRPFHGHITQFQRMESDGGLTRYRLTIEPWLSLLRYRRDSAIYQDMTVIEILESIFRDGTGEGAYTPAWQFNLADTSLYPKRSLTTQYQESDLDFVHRLMSEEGLYYWFTHQADLDSPSLGQHTLVIADHNDAFTDNPQAQIRYTQGGTVLPEDSIDQWQEHHRLATHQITTTSWDYRAKKMVTMEVIDSSPSAMSAQQQLNTILALKDNPGQYAYSNIEQAERTANIALDSIRTMRHQFIAQGTVRTAAPGTRFTLMDYLDGHIHPDALSANQQTTVDTNNTDANNTDAHTYLMTAVQHIIHNNLLSAKATQANSNGSNPAEQQRYRNTLTLIPQSTTYRSQTLDGHGLKLHPKPTVQGQQTAIVVGDALGSQGQGQIYTDRDHRIKIQYHWQRGNRSHNRLEHPYPEGHSNAPGDSQNGTGQIGTWVRVLANLAPTASDNWGSVQLPRVGQEVLVDFIEGDIDRPIVIASVYNGQGQANAQHNQISNTVPTATANAASWFNGDQGSHQHPASLSGIKSQSLSQSQTGEGGYNQLVFDDTAGQSRLSLQQHTQANSSPQHGSSELNLGHLYHQSDNQRQHAVGHGLELKTQHSVSVRSGNGLLISSDKLPINGMQMDSSLAKNLQQTQSELTLALAETAYTHHPSINQQKQPQPKAEQLPAYLQQQHSIQVISERSPAGSQNSNSTDNHIDTYSEPQLQFSSPAGIIAASNTNLILSAGNTSSLTAEHDLSMNSQHQQHYAVKDGIHLFTQGKATDPNKPNQETGIKLHAAQGKVSQQTQSGHTHVNAAKDVHIVSTQGSITIAAPEHLKLTAGGAYINIEGGDVQIHGPATMAFKAGMSNFTGPASASVPGIEFMHSPDLPKKIKNLNIRYVDADGFVPEGETLDLAYAGKKASTGLDGSGESQLRDVKPSVFNIKQTKRRKTI